MTAAPSYDVVIVGGGIHGVGVAQAAVAAGYSALVLERTALAAGTSSRSSKLIHGGLRYLESAQFSLVRESLREREILLRNAPHLVRRVPFYLPIYAHTRRRPWIVRAGLSLYSVLGGLSPPMRFTALKRTQWDSLDGLATLGLSAVFRYYDAQTDDALLTRAVMRSAQQLGAELRCPANFISALRSPDGFKVHYLEGEKEIVCHAKTLVNAAGPWANTALERVIPRTPLLSVDLVQGAHIILAGEILRGLYYVEAPRDGRAVFVMPWQGNTLVGTTEKTFDGDPAFARAHPDEIAYLLETFQCYFPQRDTALLNSFAGVRVLPAGIGASFQRSRETVLHPDAVRRPRLITIYGGKLTGYRATSARVMTLLKPALPARVPRADTASLRLTP